MADYKTKYEYWKNHKNLDAKLREELETLTEKQIEDAFYQDVQFQTAGMRGLLGVGSNRLNIHTVRKATVGFAEYLNANYENPSVAISYDNRFMSYEFAVDSAKLLSKYGVKCYVASSLRPTPELSFMVRYYKCSGGIMITASHNPKEYNGYKLYDELGCQLVPDLAAKVIANIDKIEDPLAIDIEGANDSLIEYVDKEVDDAYYKEVLGIRHNPDVKKDFKIVFSAEHGASYHPVVDTLKLAGYDVYPLVEQCEPDPAFSKTKTPNPEEPGAYEGVLAYAKELKADLILVCDPDGDRMGVGILQGDDYIILNGNQTGALLMEYVGRCLTEQNKMPANPCMFNTVVTSDFGEAVANKYGVECEKTLTGFKYIGDKVKKYEVTHEKNYVFGYEESYGSLAAPFVRDKDATQACMMLAEACAYYREKGKTLYDVVLEDYAELGYYTDFQVSTMLPGADGAVKLKAILENVRNNPITNIGDYKTIKIEDYKLRTTTVGDTVTPLTGFDVSDVLKYFFDDGSWIAIRPSGTEPKCKVYYCLKDVSFEALEAKSKLFKEVVGNIIK